MGLQQARPSDLTTSPGSTGIHQRVVSAFTRSTELKKSHYEAPIGGVRRDAKSRVGAAHSQATGSPREAGRNDPQYGVYQRPLGTLGEPSQPELQAAYKRAKELLGLDSTATLKDVIRAARPRPKARSKAVVGDCQSVAASRASPSARAAASRLLLTLFTGMRNAEADAAILVQLGHTAPDSLSYYAYSTDRGHPFQADRGQCSGRSRTP
jgi:hypothetical protein